MGTYRQFKLGVHLPSRPAPFMFLLGDRHPQPILPTPSQKILWVPFLDGEKPVVLTPFGMLYHLLQKPS